jgi:L-threonylcarbamoyladenylate synthase
MKRYSEQNIIEASRTILQGGVVLAPTDTSYALLANAFDAGAVAKIYRIKERLVGVPLPLMMAELSDAGRYGILSERDERIIGGLLPGLVSVVVRKQPRVIGDFVTAGKPSVSLMLHHHEVMVKLPWYAGVPLVVTSANRHTQGSTFSYEEAVAAVGSGVDFTIDGGKLELDQNNTVLDLTNETPTVLREGAYAFEALRKLIPDLRRAGT